MTRDIENHLIDGRVLNDLAVEAGLKPQRRDVAEFVRCHHPRTEGAGPRKVLAGRELMRMALKIAHAAFIVAGIAGDMVPRIGPGDMSSGLSDDDRKFAFEVEIVRQLWPNDIGEMPGLAIGKSTEHGGVLDFGAAGFLAVRLVVQADAENFVRIGNHRQPGDVGRGVTPGLAGGVARGAQRVGRDGGFEVGIAIPEQRADINGFVLLDDAPGAAVADFETCQSHGDVLALEAALL